MSNGKRQVEIFVAGCPACEPTVALVKQLACPSCEVSVQDMHQPEVAERAKQLGVTRVPAVAVNGQLANCCSDAGPDEAVLREAGIGNPTT
ncbi:MAG: thioredoxin family protein [Phycisphaeraceae bacterium]